MRILFDDQVFASQEVSGISRYFVELIEKLHQSDECEVVLPRRWGVNRAAIDRGWLRPTPVAPGRRGADRLALALNTPRLLTTRDVDVWHFTHYYRARLRSPRSALSVSTLYDMIPELLPELFPHGSPHREKYAYLQAVDLILSISESAKNDLLTVWPQVDPAKVVVTPLGVSETFRPDQTPLDAAPEHYVLFVGERAGYKDFSVALQAFVHIAHEFPTVQLLCVGGGPFTPEEERAIKEARLADRVTRLDLDDAGLCKAYANAELFIFPSRYEGFGLPTLEAMASGCPVVVARSSSHVEVGGEAARFFPPGEAEDLADQMGELLSDPQLRQHHVEAGLIRAADHTWERTARETLRAYQQAREARS